MSRADCSREPAVAVMAEVGNGDVVVLVRNRPHAQQSKRDQQINDDHVGERKELDGPRSEERTCGVGVAPQQEPCDNGAEQSSHEAPFIQLREIA